MPGLTMPLDAPPPSTSTAALIKDPFLLSILTTASLLRAQTLSLLDLTSASASASTSTSIPTHDTEDTDTDPAPTSASATITSSRAKVIAYMARLRAQNRQLAHAIRATKAQTASSRSEIDTLHLALQNLYYEQRHLQSEIAACEGYPHTYRDLPLVSMEEFVASEAGEAFRGLVEDGMGEWEGGEREEEIMKARIDGERKERERLEGVRAGLAKRKAGLLRENEKRKEELGKLDRQLEAFIEVSLHLSFDSVVAGSTRY
ncbi:hypothetical protein MRB53_037876 [Persea americana]|nr:hypothetical protein MRB53_037876 [Persea americana]